MAETSLYVRRRRKDKPRWHPETCDCLACWTVRPKTDSELRREAKKKERDNARNHDRPFPTEHKTRWELRRIVAWDGEGANTETGYHYYNLLANSSGDFLGGNRELTTKAALNFFLANQQPKAINVIFGGSYDVNMILRDLDRASLTRLWKTGHCHWQEYRINYTPRKRFSVSPLVWNGKRFVSNDRKTFVLWDVFGFFQCSFVDACKKWTILSDLELDAMQVMKWGRSSFTQEKFEDIRHYNQQECLALVKLVTKLFEAMDEAGIRLERYDGAGSIATSLFKKHRVFDSMGAKEDYLGMPYSPVYVAAQYSYSGARIEAPQVGNYQGEVWRYDLNSAYPSACLKLPSYHKARWVKQGRWNESPHSMVQVDFKASHPAPFYPLWWRGSVGPWRGNILYPSNAEGLYYGWEVQALRKHWVEGKDFDIRYAYNVYLHEEKHPFSWLQDIYDIRKRFKDLGSMAQEALKLGMNSIYGKLAQQEGYDERTGRYPRTHHLIWAGQITSQTRALLYNAAMENPEAIIGFATDAIFTTRPLRGLDEGPGLGQWTADRFSGITIVQPGVYWLRHTDDCDCKDCGEGKDKWHAKYRGFDPGSLSRDTLLSLWESGESHLSARLTRFITMGSALAHTEGLDGFWRSWNTADRNLSLVPVGKRTLPPRADWRPHQGLMQTVATPNVEGGQSMAYPVEWVNGERGIHPTEDGIEMAILEQEYEDSYE